MSIAFNTNTASLLAQTQLSKTTSELSKSFQRLSSGLRINNASDDPAGLALASQLNAQSRIASVALRNANDGISVASIADSALQSIGNVLDRMAELTEQAGNGTYSITQLSAVSSEFVALGSEIDRIAKTTSFNNISLLSNSSSVALQVGLTGATTSQISIQNILGTLDSLGLASTGSSSLSVSVLSTTVLDSQSSAINALNAVNAAINSVTSRRGSLGAAESRLNFAISNLSSLKQNLDTAVSNVEDVDVAQESATLVRLQVLQQAETAVLAQANQQPALVLSLLK